MQDDDILQGRQLVLTALSLGSLRFNLEEGFQWSSGLRSPIYNDNRLFLRKSSYRKAILRGLQQSFQPESCDIIAAVATAGIPYATSLADQLEYPLIYVRPASKDHGLRKIVEGLDPKELFSKRIVLIEDLISTGKSVLRIAQLLRDFGAEVRVRSLFAYDFPSATQAFAEAQLEVESLAHYDDLLAVLQEDPSWKPSDVEQLIEWKKDPTLFAQRHWGEK